MEYLNREALIYLGLILLFLIFFMRNRKSSGKKRDAWKKRSFRRRYEDRKRGRNGKTE